MELILLSGGSGKRLWPLSNDTRSKQFLKVLDDSNSVPQSMVQRVWNQLSRSELQDSALLATSRAQVEILQTQLGSDTNIIIEPERRDTFAAIALAAVYLYSIKGTSLQEITVVLPVDPYVEDPFFEKIKDLGTIITNSGADIGLIGVKPTYPSEKYGYIVPEQNHELILGNLNYSKVARFVEKPRVGLAAELMEQQALWNCGVFAFRLEYIINLLVEKGMPIQYDELLKQYDRIEKISFDYAVVEKAKHVIVTSYEGKWKDLGTWNTLTEEIKSTVIGKGVITEDSVNTHVINELDIPISVINASNLIVAASPDGILVSEKNSSHRIKDIMKLDEERPMYEERRWGRYRVLDYVKYPDGNEVLTKRICIMEGKNLSYQFHNMRREVWTVISGQGEMVLDGQLHFLNPGDVMIIPVQAKHSLRALSDMEIIEVQTGSQLIESDIIRISMKWEEILGFCVSTK